ncbi:outer membrane protein assembly factor BamE [Paraglaciecola hydrolytica]|uniref:Outer membrane protein assembly factor BamE n=1 Tax=Paraglaciecola hydrolytica TaxID=1799789 RepID=A0A136A6B0_9ALTE|nr:outer membrane protein assembly factor BamE [Paraglaciecola hydrolytica]KXI30769.1 cell envelope protein SmpA [Paraglaciecola hydrolytica]
MKFKNILVILITSLMLSACADWIFRIDVPQGNFLDEKDVKKLRINMSKEQVVYVLGKPVVEDSFDHDTWYYLYQMKRGMKKRGDDFRKELKIFFVDDRVTEVIGDFELSEDFATPLDQ